MRTTTRTRKPRAEYLRDKIAYHEAKLDWLYAQLDPASPDAIANARQIISQARRELAERDEIITDLKRRVRELEGAAGK